MGINACGTTILMVTHEHDLVRHFGGRIINIAKGEIVYDDIMEGEVLYEETIAPGAEEVEAADEA